MKDAAFLLARDCIWLRLFFYAEDPLPVRRTRWRPNDPRSGSDSYFGSNTSVLDHTKFQMSSCTQTTQMLRGGYYVCIRAFSVLDEEQLILDCACVIAISFRSPVSQQTSCIIRIARLCTEATPTPGLVALDHPHSRLVGAGNFVSRRMALVHCSCPKACSFQRSRHFLEAGVRFGCMWKVRRPDSKASLTKKCGHRLFERGFLGRRTRLRSLGFVHLYLSTRQSVSASLA